MCSCEGVAQNKTTLKARLKRENTVFLYNPFNTEY
jgi:hypothetical protein